MTLRVSVERIAVCGPGLTDWPRTASVLRGDARYEEVAIVVPPPARLPPAERRRVGPSVKLALAVAEQLFAGDAAAATATATVFTSSGGDSENCHILCEALTADEPQISPTRFTNSVHNAPSGYWSIAAGARVPSSSLCVYDASFAGGLLEAALQAVVDERPVALIAYDVPYPFPLSDKRPMTAAFGSAWLLTPVADARRGTGCESAGTHSGDTLAEANATDSGPAGTSALASRHALTELSFDNWTTGEPDLLADPALERLRAGVPAARCLPLLAAIARGGESVVKLSGPPGQVLTVHLRAAAWPPR